MDKNKTKTFVIALGSNSLIRRNQKGSAEEQYENLERTAEQLLDLLRSGSRIVITHGNGPQVGNLLLASFISPHPLQILLSKCFHRVMVSRFFGTG